MRHTTPVIVGLILGVVLGPAATATTQPIAYPTIHRVTLQPDTGVLTITGTNFGPDLQVTVDGQPVPQLPGATDTQMEVLAPVTVVTMPGTYRLTVADPMRRVGDGFVVVSPAGNLGATAGATAAGVLTSEASAADIGTKAPAVSGAVDGMASRAAAAPVPLTIIEDSGLPFNTAIGYQTLASRTSGSANTASGYQALRSDTSGGTNTATGYQALYSNTTGYFNTANGSRALYSNTTANGNTAAGQGALYDNTTGHHNTAIGSDAGAFNTVGSWNVHLGARVVGSGFDSNTIRIGLPYDSGTGEGQNRTFIAGVRGTTVTGGEVVFIDAAGRLGSGAFAPGQNSVGSAEVIDDALTAVDLAPNAVGTSELAANAVTAAKVAFNYAASSSEGGPATDVACVGCVAASEVSFSFASLGANAFVGTQTIGGGNLDLAPSTATAGSLTKNGAPFLHDFGTQNTFLGAAAGNFAMTGAYNTASGYSALASNTAGSGNTAGGLNALTSNTTGSYNTASGVAAMSSNTAGGDNTATGMAALYSNTTGIANTASGTQALFANSTGDKNTAVGKSALASNASGDSNVAVGDSAGLNATAGSYNLFLGGQVVGTASDTNTIRVGLPYDSASGVGQNQTFIAGIYGTQLTGTAAQVFVDANGRLGTGTPVAILNGTAAVSSPSPIEPQTQRQQAVDAAQDATIGELQAVIGAQDATIRDLRARLDRLEAATRGGKRQ